jgi:hypothetical protein
VPAARITNELQSARQIADNRLLEINPKGQWAWLENVAGAPIAGAIWLNS